MPYLRDDDVYNLIFLRCVSAKILKNCVLGVKKGMHRYSLNLGICSVEEAKLWAIVHGMRLAWETGSKRIQVETNCLMIVNWL